MSKHKKKNKHLNKIRKVEQLATQPSVLPMSLEKEQTDKDGITGKNLMKYKYLYLAISAFFIIPGVVSLALFGLKTSIDFTGGSVLKYSRPDGSWDKSRIEQILADKGVEVISLTDEDGGRTLNIKAKSVDADRNEEIKTEIIGSDESVSQTSFETVGPSIGAETVKKSLLAFSVACLCIVLYIAYAFRNVPKPFSGLRFGVSAILAMVHDTVIVTGMFSILGQFRGVEVDPMFITALLTTLGFSVHDTIVVFDRMRENLGKFKSRSTEWIANYAVLETMRRSLINSATIVITLTALFVFGGVTIKWFVFALLVGVISGTYSSMFNAVPVLVIWENFLNKRTKK